MKLKDICEINPRTQGIADYTSVSFVPMPCVSEDGKIDPSDIRQFIDVKKGYTVFQENDVLFAKITPCMENGKGAIARGLMNGIGCGSSEFHVLRANNEMVCPEWIYYLTAWSNFRREAEKHMTGSAGQRRVPKAYLENYDINVPSLPEQTKQTKVLSQLQQIIDCRRKELQKLDELIKARFVELFGDPKLNDKGWDSGIVSDYYDVKGGKRIPKGMGYADGVTAHPYLRATDMKNETILDDDIHYIEDEVFEHIKRYTVKGGDIYLTNVGVNLGMAGVIPDKYDGANLTENAVKLVPKTEKVIDGVFLAHYINSPGIQDYINERKMSVGVPKLAIFRIETMPLLLPPMEIQMQFIEFCKQVDKSKVTETLIQITTLYKTLIHPKYNLREAST